MRFQLARFRIDDLEFFLDAERKLIEHKLRVPCPKSPKSRFQTWNFGAWDLGLIHPISNSDLRCFSSSGDKSLKRTPTPCPGAEYATTPRRVTGFPPTSNVIMIGVPVSSSAVVVIYNPPTPISRVLAIPVPSPPSYLTSIMSFFLSESRRSESERLSPNSFSGIVLR